MDDEFRALVLGDAARRVRRRGLRVVDRGCAGVASALDGPATLVRNDVLILASHRASLLNAASY